MKNIPTTFLNKPNAIKNGQAKLIQLDHLVTMHQATINHLCRSSVAHSILNVVDRLLSARESIKLKIKSKKKLSWVKRLKVIKHLRKKLSNIERDIYSWIKSSCHRCIELSS